MACLNCRRRKLRCDKKVPTCNTCLKTGRDCEYDAQPKKRGPKKRNLKALEERLEYLERGIRPGSAASLPLQPTSPEAFATKEQSTEEALDPSFALQSQEEGQAQVDFSNDIQGGPFLPNPAQVIEPSLAAISVDQAASFLPDFDIFGFDFGNASFGDLGAPADMPSPRVNQALADSFFDFAYPFTPLIHRQRFEQGEPPLCLQYAVWATGALWSPEYRDRADGFYRRARSCLEEDEMLGHGEGYLTLAHCQSWVLLTACDSMNHSVVRATMNSRRATALCQMFGLDRLDSEDTSRRKMLPPAVDWIETEERRRTFWAAFCSDRWASAGHGWSTTIDEKQIATNLPASEKAFKEGIEEQTGTLSEAYARGFNEHTSYFAALCVVNLIVGYNMLYLQRRNPSNDDPRNVEEQLITQHRHMDKSLSKLLLTLPPHLQLPSNLRDPQVVHLNMTLNGAIISLHLATMAKLDNVMDAAMRRRCLQYCFVAAEEVMNCLRLAAHIGISKLHPFAGFAMFMAAHTYLRVEEGPFSEAQNRDNLELILAVTSKLYERYNMLWPLFARLCVDVGQSKHGELIDGRYREASARLMETEGKANPNIAQRLKEHPMPGMLPRMASAKQCGVENVAAALPG